MGACCTLQFNDANVFTKGKRKDITQLNIVIDISTISAALSTEIKEASSITKSGT